MSSPEETTAMSGRRSLTLVAYLLAAGVTLLYLLIKLYTVEFPDPALAVSAPAGEPDVTALSKGTGPVIFHVFAHLKAGSVAASPPTYELAVYGDRFQKDAKVRLNGDPRPPTALLEDNLLRVAPQSRDVENVTAVTVEVANPDGHRSNTITLPITRPRMPLKVFTREWPITREIQLILMVLCAGALGSFVHAVKSLVDYIGNRRAMASWFWWYISRPFLGATMAFIFYAVLRGGFLTGTPADVRVVNPFGAIAVAALVGMFADKASHKLAEIFETLFKADDRRSGKLAGPVVERLVPGTVRVGSSQPIDVKVVGERLAKASTVRVNGIDRAPERSDEREVVVKLLPSDLARPGALTISVVTPDGTSPAATLQVSDLEITTTAVPPKRVGEDYKGETIAARGGTQPYSWTLQGGPGGVKIDPARGTLSGASSAAGTSKATVTVTDKTRASDSKTFDMQVTP